MNEGFCDFLNLTFNRYMETPSNQDFLRALVNNFLKGKSILIIDDEEEILKVIENYLIKCQIDRDKIIFARDGEQALLEFENNKIGLIIVDLQMPKINGIEFIEQIKQREEHKEIPIVISSGNINGNNLQTAILLGIRDIIVKPFSYNLFVDRLCKALNIP